MLSRNARDLLGYENMHHKNVGEIQESLNDFLIISENKMVPND
jgi:hypothetical protein